MKTRRTLKFWTVILFCLQTLAVPLAHGADLANKKQFIRAARQAYYNLRTEGLVEFRCSLTPNWEALLGDTRKSDPAAADRAVKKLSELRFWWRLGPDGKLKLTHNELTPENKGVAEGLSQIFGGMEQMTSGFYDTWKVFMLDAPFPEVESEYQLEALGPQYGLAYKDGATNVLTTIGKDFVIKSINVSSSEFDSTIAPQFNRHARGLVLSGYVADYKSSKPGETTHLIVQIDYQEVSGLQLPRRLDLRGTYGEVPIGVELTFSGCEATKK